MVGSNHVLSVFSTVLYVLFAFVLAATCTREALLTDYIIAERVAATGESKISRQPLSERTTRAVLP